MLAPGAIKRAAFGHSATSEARFNEAQQHHVFNQKPIGPNQHSFKRILLPESLCRMSKNSGTDFEVLLQTILSSSNLSKREDFIRKNTAKIIPLVKWLCRTILSIADGSNDSKSSKYARVSKGEAETTEINDLVSFALDGIFVISSAATDETIEKNICQAVCEEIEFLTYLNNQILLPCDDASNPNLNRHLGILVNFTREENFVCKMVKATLTSSKLQDFLSKLVDQIRMEKLAEHTQHLYLFAAYLNNLCQSEVVRSFMVKNAIFLKLFDLYNRSKTDFQLRRLIIELIRNCCLDVTLHREMITEQDPEFLVQMVLPLAGGEELDSGEIDSLPLDLQYLPVDKEREPDPVIRRSLIEAIHQLCCTRYGRKIIRNTNIYYLLREYHKWEKNPELIEALMKLIDIIIKTEEEIQVDNLKELELPADLEEKFQQMDKELVQLQQLDEKSS